MFSHLSLDIRLLIWETILYQPRVVYINLRALPEPPEPPGSFICAIDEPRPDCRPICTTPVPILLHICSETRALALTHYQLTFGRAPVSGRYRPSFAQFRKFRYHRPIKGLYNSALEAANDVMPAKSEAEIAEDEAAEADYQAEVAESTPKIYFNFQYDTVLFGHAWPAEGIELGVIDFRFEDHLDNNALHKIETLALRMDERKRYGGFMLTELERLVTLGVFPRLKKLYFCLEEEDLNPSQGVEFVDLFNPEQTLARDKRLVQKFVDVWNVAFETSIRRRMESVVEGVDTEALKSICRRGLEPNIYYHGYLRTLLLKNGACLDELPKFAWVRNTR